MNEEFNIEEQSNILLPQEEQIAPQIEAEVTIEASVEEVVKPVKKTSKKKAVSNVHNVIQIIQKRPSTYCLNVEGKGRVIVHKSKFDRAGMKVTLD